MNKWKGIGFTEKEVTCGDGLVLNYGEGPTGNVPLLLIHGQTMCWEDYEKVLPDLAKEFHVYAIDCPGHGKSSHDPKYYTCKQIGDDLVEFVRKVIKKPCVVSGHSSGGILAGYVAAHEKKLVKAVLFEDPPFFSVQPEEMQNTFVWKDSFEVMHNYLNQKEETNYSAYYFQHSYIFGLFGPKLTDRLSKRARTFTEHHPEKPIRLFPLPEAWLHGMKYINQFDLLFAETFYNGSWFDGVSQKEILQNVSCPTVYLKAVTQYGKDGVLYGANTDAESNKMVELLENCQRILVKSGHDIHYEKPEEFVRAALLCKR